MSEMRRESSSSKDCTQKGREYNVCNGCVEGECMPDVIFFSNKYHLKSLQALLNEACFS